MNPRCASCRLSSASSMTPGSASRRGRDEPITATRDRFYVPWLARIVVEHGAKIADGALQHRIADEPVTPDLIEQGVLGQQRARLPDERTQQSERCRCNRRRTSVAKQERVRLVELVFTEANTQGGRASRGASHASSLYDAAQAAPSILARCHGGENRHEEIPYCPLVAGDSLGDSYGDFRGSLGTELFSESVTS
jgi:hypothetical protein